MESIVITFIVANWEKILSATGALPVVIKGIPYITNKTIELYKGSDKLKIQKITKLIKHLKIDLNNNGKSDIEELQEIFRSVLMNSNVNLKDIKNLKMNLKKYLEHGLTMADKTFFNNIQIIASTSSNIKTYFENKKVLTSLVGIVNNIKTDFDIDETELIDYFMSFNFNRPTEILKKIVDDLVEKVKNYVKENKQLKKLTTEARKNKIINFIIENIKADRFNIKDTLLRELNITVHKIITPITEKVEETLVEEVKEKTKEPVKVIALKKRKKTLPYVY
jgi:hypothetical protein